MQYFHYFDTNKTSLLSFFNSYFSEKWQWTENNRFRETLPKVICLFYLIESSLVAYKKYDELFSCMIKARYIKNYTIDINDSYNSFHEMKYYTFSCGFLFMGGFLY